MIKAIDTPFDGYLFRSRLEARWAVFFKTLGIEYSYEREGYNLDGLWYLPDFWLPKQKFWIEIKGEIVEDEDYLKICRFAKQKTIYLLQGDIPYITEESEYTSFPEPVPCSPYGAGDCCHTWCECPDCGFVGIEYAGWTDRLACKECTYCYLIKHRETCNEWLHPTKLYQGNSIPGCYQCIGEPIHKICPIHKETPKRGCPLHSAKMSKHPNYNSPRLIAAYTAARQARFEHKN